MRIHFAILYARLGVLGQRPGLTERLSALFTGVYRRCSTRAHRKHMRLVDAGKLQACHFRAVSHSRRRRHFYAISRSVSDRTGRKSTRLNKITRRCTALKTPDDIILFFINQSINRSNMDFWSASTMSLTL